MHVCRIFTHSGRASQSPVTCLLSSGLQCAEWGDSIKADLQKYSGPGVARLLVFVHGMPLKSGANELHGCFCVLMFA